MRRAAFLQQRADLFGRPSDDGVVRGLLEAGFAVDHYSPGGEGPQSVYPDAVRRRSIEYRARWLRENLRLGRRRGYDVFAANTDLPMAFAGILAAVARTRLVCVCDEIYAGGYHGPAARHWKPIARWGMRRADFTVITDPARIPLQREHAGLDADHPFHEYPSAFPEPLEGRFDRDAVRAELGIGPEERVVAHAGNVSASTGGAWAVRLVERLPERWKLLLQPGGPPDPLVHALFETLARGGRVAYLPERLEWLESMRWTSAADVGLVIYLSEKPQFQAMGVSSNKLCMFLSLGTPVVATRQPSFQFIEDLGGGVLVESEAELPEAIARIDADRERFGAGARRCFDEYIRPAEKLASLTEAFRAL